MLLSEENERLRAELERMKSLAATLLGAPSIRAHQEPQNAPQLIGLPRFNSNHQLLAPVQEPSNSFQLSLSQPSIANFIGLSDATALNKHVSLSSNVSPHATNSLGSFSMSSGLQPGGNLQRQGSGGLQHLQRQGSGGLQLSAMLSSGGQARSQQPLLGTAPYSLENLQAFAGNIRSTPVQRSQPTMPLGVRTTLPEIPPEKKEEKFVYPGLSQFVKKLSNPFSSPLPVGVPPVPTSTAQRIVKKQEPSEEEQEEKEPQEPERRSRKRDREGSDDNRKMRLSKEQSSQLEAAFNEQSTHSLKQKNALALRLGLRPRQVEVWFQNRRARSKLKQTEVDCEVLKRCCETLTEENQRLQKEVITLKAWRSGDGPRGEGAGPFCVKCSESIAPAEASGLQLQSAEPGSVEKEKIERVEESRPHWLGSDSFGADGS